MRSATLVIAVCGALGDAGTTELIGQEVEFVYSRIDADGGLREARVCRATAR
jgi:hypothetical protein